MNRIINSAYNSMAEELARNPEAASAYVQSRIGEAENFSGGLIWVKGPCPFTIAATTLYGIRIVHELSPRRLHASACWGELFFNDTNSDPMMLETFDCFIAYMLCRYW